MPETTIFKSKRAKQNGVFLIAPPWPRSGSANIFANQAASHAALLHSVFTLIGPFHHWHTIDKESFWRDTAAAMNFPDSIGTGWAITNDQMRPWRSKSFYRWLLAGGDNCLAVAARYAKHARLPPQALAFIHDYNVDIIHVNHVFEMALARKVAQIVKSSSGKRPQIICETHDIQAENYAAAGQVNPFSGLRETREAILKTELALLREADILTHCAPADFDFFSSCLPNVRHEQLLPSIAPAVEATLRTQRGRNESCEYDFIYVGNNNRANAISVRWLLEKVVPLLPSSIKIAIVGRVAELVMFEFPDLYGKCAGLFVGEVPDIVPLYAMTRAVLSPAIEGTGSSIKLIEALCAGKQQIITSHAARGLPADLKRSDAFIICDTPEEFVSAMQASASGKYCNSSAPADLYERFFSSERYRQRLSVILAELSQQLEKA